MDKETKAMLNEIISILDGLVKLYELDKGGNSNG